MWQTDNILYICWFLVSSYFYLKSKHWTEQNWTFEYKNIYLKNLWCI